MVLTGEPKYATLVLMQIFGNKKTKWYKQDSQILGARKTNGINRRSKIWEQEKQMV
jgi:hypothetical protein